MALATKESPARCFWKTVPSPVGRLKLVATDRGLKAILWENDKPGRVDVAAGEECSEHPVLKETERQLGEYFAGGRNTFRIKQDVAGTPFQKQVWERLETIPYGETRSYGEIAHGIGKPAAVRAVGAAIGRNPLSIIVPCHRVLGSSGALTGFAGGLESKKKLLALEVGKETAVGV